MVHLAAASADEDAVTGRKGRESSLGEGADAVLDAARHGDADAWKVLYETFAGRVAGYLRVQGAREPEDLTSEVFLAAFRHLPNFVGGEAQFRSWLFVIAHRRLIDERRRRQHREDDVPLEASMAQAGDSEADALRSLATQRVQEVCARLAPDQRDVLLLRLIGDLTIEQVANVLGKTPGAVKALQRRGLAAITRLVEREGVPL